MTSCDSNAQAHFYDFSTVLREVWDWINFQDSCQHSHGVP